MTFIAVDCYFRTKWSIERTESDDLLMDECFVIKEHDKNILFTKITARSVFACTTLMLQRCKLTDNDVYVLAKAIQGNTSLFHLSLSDNPISVDGLRCLMRTLMTCNVCPIGFGGCAYS